MTATSSWRDEVVALIPALRAFAWSLSHNSSDADDLVQDTLIKAWTNREKFEPGTNLRAWLFTILRNTYYTTVLRRRREVRDEMGEYAGTLKTPAADPGRKHRKVRAGGGPAEAPARAPRGADPGGRGGPLLRGGGRDLRLHA